jgi:putative metallohydrolase (TIGR04338 family)
LTSARPDVRQRQEDVYAAEDAALQTAGRVFHDLGEVRAYVADLIDTDWWAERWPQIEAIPVAETRSGRFGGYAVEQSGEIRLARRALREPVVLHEIAHVVTAGAGHGPAFVAALLALVRERLGFHAYGALLAELRRRDLVEEAEGDPHRVEDPDPS